MSTDQVELLNCIHVWQLCCYVSANQMDWDPNRLLLTCRYNVQVRETIKVSPFSLVLTRTILLSISQSRNESYRLIVRQSNEIRDFCNV